MSSLRISLKGLCNGANRNKQLKVPVLLNVPQKLHVDMKYQGDSALTAVEFTLKATERELYQIFLKYSLNQFSSKLCPKN